MNLQFDGATLQRLEALYQSRDARQRRRKVLDALRVTNGERVLDVGTGAGFLAEELADAVGSSGQVLGVDNSETMLAAARRRCAGKRWVRFEAGEANCLPVASESFDIAVSVQVYEYVRNIELAIAELKRILRPAGRAAIVATDWDGIAWASADNARMTRVLAAFRAHCEYSDLPRSLSGKLREGGLDIVEQQVIPQFNPDCGPLNYSYHMIRIISEFVVGNGLLPENEVSDWAADLDEHARSGRYFFCLNQYLFLVVRP